MASPRSTEARDASEVKTRAEARSTRASASRVSRVVHSSIGGTSGASRRTERSVPSVRRHAPRLVVTAAGCGVSDGRRDVSSVKAQAQRSAAENPKGVENERMTCDCITRVQAEEHP